MPTSIHIQYKFFTGLTPVLVLLFILIFLPIVYALGKKKTNKKEKTKPQNQKQEYADIAEVLRKKYLGEVYKLDLKIKSSEISIKDGYQGLSLLMRAFVKEKTGVDVTNKTLAEIRGLNMLPLEKLLEEYYEYEFSNNNEDSTEKINEAIAKTIRTIKEWY